MSSFLKLIGLIAIGVLASALAFFFIGFFVVIIGVFILMFGLAWAIDARFKVNVDGKHVGYYSRKSGYRSL